MLSNTWMTLGFKFQQIIVTGCVCEGTVGIWHELQSLQNGVMFEYSSKFCKKPEDAVPEG